MFQSMDRMQKLFSQRKQKNPVKHDISVPVMSMFSDAGATDSANAGSFDYIARLKGTLPSQQGKILIVDDERFNCDIIFGFLMILGVKNRKELTTFAYNGEQAVSEILKAIEDGEPYRYSLILMDCNMPFLDGYEATKRIRKLYQNADIERAKQPKVIAITGHVENEYVKKAMSSGMDKVYQKPLPIGEFGNLLMKMKFIENVPSNLRIDSHEY